MVQTLKQLSENIWIFPRDPDIRKVRPNIGIVCTPTQTVLFDAGNGPQHAREIQAALTEIHAPPVSHVIYSHFHWDHTFGAQVFPHATIIGHVECMTQLQAVAQQSWNREYLQQHLQDDPHRDDRFYAIDHAITDWDNFHILLPNFTFTDNMTLYLDGATIELTHVGGIHSSDSIIAYIKEAEIAFVSDCFYPPPFVDGPLNFDMLKSLMETRAIKLFVDGHSSRPLSARMIQRKDM